MKLLHLPSKSITGAAFILAGTTLLSRIMGMLRDRVLAHEYSIGTTIDAYYAAFKIPDLIYNLLIIGSLTAGFIPTFTKLLHQENKNDAWKLANNILNILAISLIVLCGIGILLSPHLSFLIAPGFDSSTKELTSMFTRIIFLSPFFLGISMVLGGILQSFRHFFIYSIAPLFYNLGIIIGALILVPLIGISGLAWGVVLGAVLHCSIQLYGAYQSGFRWQWYFNLKDSSTKLIAKLTIPRTLGLAITQFNTIVITVLASTLAIGSVGIYNYAHNIQAVPTGLIGIPFALAVFPLLSAATARKDMAEFNSLLFSTIRQIFFLIIPLSILFLLLRAQIVRVILGSGKFDWTATVNTANALAFFSLGLCAQSLLPILARAFYALSDTLTPFVIGIISELISIITALILIRPQFNFSNRFFSSFYGVNGLAFATSFGVILNIVLLFIFLRRKTKYLEGQKLLTLFYKISLAGLAMGVAIQVSEILISHLVNMNTFFGILLHGVISGIIGLLVYTIICYICKVEEVAHTYLSLKKKWLKMRNIPEMDSEQTIV